MLAKAELRGTGFSWTFGDSRECSQISLELAGLLWNSLVARTYLEYDGLIP